MQSAAGPGQPVISSCQREAESTRNLGGMREGRRGSQHGEGGACQLCVHYNHSASDNCNTFYVAVSLLEFPIDSYQ